MIFEIIRDASRFFDYYLHYLSYLLKTVHASNLGLTRLMSNKQSDSALTFDYSALYTLVQTS